MGEIFGQLLGAFQVVDLGEAIFVSGIVDSQLVHFFGQTFSPVDVDLDLEREPALDADVHESKLGIEIVEVEKQSLPFGALQYEPVTVWISMNLVRHA